MQELPEEFLVRFNNRAAIQDFQEAMVLIANAVEEDPWREDLAEAKRLLDDAWDGLSFSVKE